MFKKKKLYKITYKILSEYSVIIEAKDECQAIRKFNKFIKKKNVVVHSIISFEEYKVVQQK